MVSNEETVKTIQIESGRVIQFLNGLAQESMERATPCEMWSVGDMIAHLVWFAETYGGMMERGLRGDMSPPEGFPDPETISRGEIEELYARLAINRRKDLGPDLLDALNERYDWLNNLLMGIGPEDWKKPCQHTLSVRSVESFLPTIIQELAVHEWDIRSSLGPAPSLSAASLPTLMGKLPLGKPHTNPRPWSLPFPTGPDSSMSLRYRFDLSGPGSAELDLVVEGDKTRLEDPAEVSADLHVTGDTSTFILIMYERLSLDSAISNGRFTAEGDLELVATFDHWLATH